MLVREVMQSPVVTVTPETTLPEALGLLQGRRIRHLPVVEEGRLVGIVSDRDVKQAMPWRATALDAHEIGHLQRLPVRELMTRAVVTIGPMFPVEQAAQVMAVEKISALPVTEGGRLVGIVTETDVLQMLVRATGASEPSSRVDVVLGDRPGALGEVVQAVEAAGARIVSIMTFASRSGAREVSLRVSTINPGPAVKALEARGYTVADSWRD
jgi:acetoin utilization protein AcuB